MFFPSALLLAPLNILLWLAIRDRMIVSVAVDSPAWHGREMIFGYSLAVIAGFLLQEVSGIVLALLWLLWLAARLLGLLPLHGMPVTVELVVAGAFPVAVALLGAARFSSVRRARNLLFPPIMTLLGVAAVAAYAVELALLPAPARSPAALASYVVAVLIMTMGGRLLPTATVGAMRAAGRHVRIPPQPALEFATAAGMLGLIAGEMTGRTRVSGAAALAVAATLLLRMTGWHAVRVLHDPLVWPLHLGFFWLALGCALIGLDRLAVMSLPGEGALHALAAGGIGTVTLAMMIRVTGYRSGGVSALAVHLLHLVLALAVLMRVCGDWLLPAAQGLALWLSAIGWTVAYTGAAAMLIPLALRSRPGSA